MSIDPDPDGESGSGLQEGKNDDKKVKDISFFKLLDVLFGDLIASELRFSHQKTYTYFRTVKFVIFLS